MRPLRTLLSSPRAVRGLIGLATVAGFFALSRLLPPIETGTYSLAAAAGYTNQVGPLVAVLLAGALAAGAALWRDTSRAAFDVDAPTMTASWRWQVLAAAVISVLIIVLAPEWSTLDTYFGARVALMDAGRKPYVDFEYAYGCLVAYLPYWLHGAGLSIPDALKLALSGFAVAGVFASAAFAVRWVTRPVTRSALFWSLVACGALVAPGPSLTYNFGRYVLPFWMSLVLASRVRAGGWAIVLATSMAANVLIFCISPELGCAFTVAVVVWLATCARSVRWPVLVAALAGLAVSTLALVVFAGPMFTTLLAFGSGQVLQPVAPSPIMLLFVTAFLAVGALATVSTLQVLCAGPDTPQQADWRLCAALAGALLPAAIGRAWPTITLAYGFAPIIMLAGRRLAKGDRVQGYAVTAVFVAFVAYQVGLNAPDVLRSIPHRSFRHPAATRPSDRPDRRRVYPADLRARFPMPYDPLAVAAITDPLTTEVGYFPGLALGNAVTTADMARKTRELVHSGVYILPTDRKLVSPHNMARVAKGLAAYRRASLYPLPLRLVRSPMDPWDGFMVSLRDRCRPLAQSDGFTVCALKTSLSGP